MKLNLERKRVLITGSTGGIGKAIAKGFLEEGAVVIINGLFENEVKDAVKDLASIGNVSGITADVSKADGVEFLYDEAVKNGDIDIFINNVGIFKPIPFENITDQDWYRYFDVNFMSAARLSRKILPSMIRNNSGRIILIASEAGIKPIPEMIHYSVTKTALIGLARGMAELTKGSKVTVNSILPGPTWTEGVKAYFDGLAAEQGKEIDQVTTNYFIKEEPTSLIQRFIDVDEITNAVLMLSSSSAINGSAMRVEGGIIRSL